jgi:hypothetical protein
MAASTRGSLDQGRAVAEVMVIPSGVGWVKKRVEEIVYVCDRGGSV